MKVTIKVEGRALTLADSINRALVKALRRAGNDAARAMRAEARRQTRDRVAMKSAFMGNASMPLTLAKGSKLETMFWRMAVSGKPVPLLQGYPARQTRNGVSAEIVRGKRTVITSAFIRNSRSGRQSVFLREGKPRLPIHSLFGMSLAQTFSDGRTAHASIERFESVFSKAFARLYAMELGK